MRFKQVPPMEANEIDDIPFIFTKDMAADETIVNSAISILDDQNTEQPALLLGSPVVGKLAQVQGAWVFTPDSTGTVVLQRIKAGTGNKSYVLRATITLQTGRKLSAVGILPILAVSVQSLANMGTGY